MKAVVTLEMVGDDTYHLYHLMDRQMRCMGLTKEADILFADSERGRPWVARIVGTHPRYRYEREFVVPSGKDNRRANSVGSRGVYSYYTLSPGIYEVNARLSWKRCRRYFLRVTEDGEKQEIGEDEVKRCLASII